MPGGVLNTGEYPSVQPTRIGNGSFVTVGLLVTMLGVAGTFGMAYQRLGSVEDAGRRRDGEISALRVEMAEARKDAQKQEIRTTRLEDGLTRIERGQDRMERKLDQLGEAIGSRFAGGRQPR